MLAFHLSQVSLVTVSIYLFILKINSKGSLCIPSLSPLEPQKLHPAKIFSVFWIAYLFLHRIHHDCRMLALCGLNLGYRAFKNKIFCRKVQPS